MSDTPVVKNKKGAGRKPGGSNNPTAVLNSAKTLAARKILLTGVAKHYKPIIQSMVESAKGMWYEDHVDEINPETGRKTGRKLVRIFREKPDTRAGEFLINQVAGKPKESVEHTGRVTLEMDE